MKLTEEQRKKLEKCESKEEILKLVDEENIELDDGDLEKINGGEYNPFTTQWKSESSKYSHGIFT